MTAGPPPGTRYDGESVHALHHREEVMGTIVTIDVYTRDGRAGAAVQAQLARAVAGLHQADAIFSTWQHDSPVSRLRRGAIAVDQAPPEVGEVLALCATARDWSGGWFDPWAMPGGVDPTGYVKGWAAQRAAAAFRARSITGVIVNAAGDIACTGGLGHGAPFRFGVADPFRPGQLAAIVTLTAAIATSGTYERGAHLIDPHSGQPRAAVASASVTGPDLGVADALATGLAVAGEPGLAAVAALPGYAALLIGHDGAQRWTGGFPLAARRADQAVPRG
jgi:thiamine biosynthesis lipoprotein